MYIPPAFTADREAALAFAAKRGFGLLVAVEAGRPVASHLPFLIERDGERATVACHVARANRLHEVLAREPAALLAVTGPDAYISPDWYRSEDQVPTWTYVSVHLSGTARVLSREANLLHVDALSARFEADLVPKRPWTSAKMSERRREAMLTAIVSIEIEVESVEGQWKLNQHKGEADHAGVVETLGRSADPDAREIAQLMQAARASRR